jgi:hypothetical protein
MFYHVHRSLRKTGYFPQAIAEHEHQWHDRKDDVLVLFSKARIQKYAECLRRLAFHSHMYRRLCMMMVFSIPWSFLYHIQKVQQLLPGDHTNHVQFCRWLKRQSQIMNYDLFIDEVQFHHDGITSTRNSHS